MEDKKNMRKYYRQLRDQMDQEEVKCLSEKICRYLLDSDMYGRSQFIYAYYPLGNEVDIRSVAEDAWKQGKRVAFPKVFGEEMRFFEVKDFSQLHPGSFHVMEPEETDPVDWENALVLTPGVAFDRKRNRMGYGKGYYDRHFECKRDVVMIGVAYELQVADQIPVGRFDRVLDGLVTEQGIF